jgi:hypothetical protein
MFTAVDEVEAFSTVRRGETGRWFIDMTRGTIGS